MDVAIEPFAEYIDLPSSSCVSKNSQAAKVHADLYQQRKLAFYPPIPSFVGASDCSFDLDQLSFQPLEDGTGESAHTEMPKEQGQEELGLTPHVHVAITLPCDDQHVHQQEAGLNLIAQTTSAESPCPDV